MSKPNYNRINEQWEKINLQLFKRIEELALKVVKANDGITGFCMAMGSESFSVDFMETDDGYPGELFHKVDDLDSRDMLEYEWKHEAAIKEIIYILDEYNWNFKLTGTPVRIRKINGEIIVDYDW